MKCYEKKVDIYCDDSTIVAGKVFETRINVVHGIAYRNLIISKSAA